MRNQRRNPKRNPGLTAGRSRFLMDGVNAERVILHLDMDAFYASVEQRDDPQLKGRPVVVGGSPQSRGVVCAASYQARRYGVRSAMPCATAYRLCPHAVFLRPRMADYREESKAVMAIVETTGARVQQVSVDEAYLDLSAQCPGNSHDDRLSRAQTVALALKQAIRGERRLTASIGVAGNKLLAKLGSDFDKPDGLTVIREGDKVAFLRPLPVGAIHGVGRVTEKALRLAGIQTVGDLQDFRGDLRSLVGSFDSTLKRYAVGEDDRELSTDDPVKSISSENTFDRDTDDRRLLRECLWEQAQDIHRRLLRHELAAQTVSVKVRYSDFTTLTRQVTGQDPVIEARELYRLGCWLLARERLVHRPLRLLGLGASHLVCRRTTQLPLPLETWNRGSVNDY